ncbi:MAG: exo-alpha-sialidase [Rhizobiales bacterium]|nr:exo-alpha-sialidase [Hyphomicrobiales bacterium]
MERTYRFPNSPNAVTRGLFSGVAALAFLAASPASAGELVKVSKDSPFANCTADNVAGQLGTNYPDSEIEPWISVNPLFKNNLIAGWQQDRWSNGGARGLVGGVSYDGGRNWFRSVPPKITLCTGGPWERASDPWVAISPLGIAFFQSLAFQNDRPDGGLGANAVLVSRSTNGGFTWSKPIALIEDNNGQVFNDKNSITADPFDSRYIYGTWDRLVDFTLPENNAAGKAAKKSGGNRDGVAIARDRLRKLKSKTARKQTQAAAAEDVTFIGPTYFVRTTNGGISWEKAKEIYDPGPDAQTIGNIAEVLGDGSVAVFFTNISSLGETSLGLIRSRNKGRTFGTARLPITTNVTLTGSLTPNTEQVVRDGNILFDVAVDRRSGNLYLVWQDSRFQDIDQVAFSMSRDHGRTWSDPVKINMTPESANLLRNQAFVPSVEVGPQHEITVTYYDFRNDTDEAGKELTDYFAVFCTPGHGNDCSKRENWGDGAVKGKDTRITDRSFNMLDAPDARGLFLGDYMGLARKGNVVMPAFGIADGPNRVSVYTKPIRSKKPMVAGN